MLFTFNQMDLYWYLSFALPILGFFVGWWLCAMRNEKKMQLEMDKHALERSRLQAEWDASREAFELKEADYKRVALENQQLAADAAVFAAKERDWQEKLLHQENSVELIRLDFNAAEGRNTGLQEQILGLRTINAQITGENMLFREQINAYKALNIDFSAMTRQVSMLEEAVAQLEAERNAIQKSLTAALAENETVKELLSERETAGLLNHLIPSAPKNGVSKSLSTAIDTVDDLQIINGITASFEKTLKKSGISQWDQISRWTTEEVDAIAVQLKIKPERILGEDWVGQAKHLLERR